MGVLVSMCDKGVDISKCNVLKDVCVYIHIFVLCKTFIYKIKALVSAALLNDYDGKAEATHCGAKLNSAQSLSAPLICSSKRRRLLGGFVPPETYSSDSSIALLHDHISAVGRVCSSRLTTPELVNK